MALALHPSRGHHVVTPAVTAVVVVHGSPEPTVRACVGSLLDSVGVDLDVILVDNASPDGGAACAPWEGHERVMVIHSARNDGFAAGVNQGLRARRPGALVWLLNDDATVEPDCITQCIEKLTPASDIVAVAPRVMLAAERERVDSIGVVLRPNGEAFNAHIGRRWDAQVDDGADVFGPCFAAALFRADAFDDTAVGPIDDRYRLYYEDIDWNLRAARLGLRTVAATSAVVWHQHAASTRLLGEPARYELVQRNLLLCATKHFSRPSVARVWGSRLLVHAKGIITGPMRIQRIRSVARAVAGAPAVLRRRSPLDPATEARVFAFAAGMTPRFSAETYASLDD
jgi:GT2 family glycosyltransferase